MSICLSPGGSSIYRVDTLSRVLHVATQGGVVELAEQSDGSWRESARGLDEHHVVALVRDPLRGDLYAGTHDAGVFSSADGRRWHACSEGLEIDNVFSLACVARGDELRLYAGTEPAALFESRDFGRHWRRLGGLEQASGAETWMFPAPPFLGHVKVITIHPHNPDCIYVAVEQGGLYRSDDAGETWVELTAGMPNDAHRVVLHPDNPERLYLCNGFFFNRSDDGGRSWDELKHKTDKIGYADPLVFHPNKPEVMLVAGAFATPDTWVKGSANSSIARTGDGGDSWAYARGGLPQEIRPSIEAMCIQAAGEQSRVFAGNTDGEEWMSADEGEHWQRIAERLPPVSKCFHADLIHGKLDLSDVRVPEEIRELMAQMAQRSA